MVFAFFVRLVALVLLGASLVLTLLTLARPVTPAPLLSLTRFTPNASFGSALWLRDLQRGVDMRLLDSSRLLYSLWLPSGEQFVYFYDDAEGSAVYLYDVATGKATLGAMIPRLLPLAWSPDERWLLLYNFSTNEIFAMPHDDGQLGTPVYVAFGSSDVLWSPDAQQLYFLDATATLGVIDAACLDGPVPCIAREVATGQPIAQLAGWMPDGDRLMVVAGRRESGQPDLYSLDPAGGELELLAEYLLPGAPPVWSPDGETLALSLALPANETPSSGTEPIPGVYLIEDGGSPRLLWAGIAGQLGWSPAGRRLAFELISRVGSDRSIWVYDRESDTLARTTRPGVHEAAPRWIVFPGRPFQPAGPVALAVLLAAGLWLARPREPQAHQK